MKQALTIFLIFIIVFAKGQKNNNDNNWLPVLETNLPSRVFSVKLNNRFDHHISSTSPITNIGNGSTEIRSNRAIILNLKFPIINKSNYKITGGLYYLDEEFKFENEGNANFPLYESLEDRNLKNLGCSFNGIFHLHSNRSIIARTNFSLAGDFYRDNDLFSFSKILKASVAIGYGIKKDENTFYAFGAYFGYTFGVPSLYPAFGWSKRFNESFGVDVLLPQSMRLWKKTNEKTYFYLNAKVTGDSYTIRVNKSILAEMESLQLRKAFITSSLGIYKRLSSWIWLDIEAGFSQYLSFNVAESNFEPNHIFPRPDNNNLIESKVGGVPYVSVSFFMSPPKGFLDNLH